MISTVRRVPVDLIIHSLAERFDPSKNDSAERFTDDALSLGLYACIHSDALAEEWAVSGGIAQTAEWMATIIEGRDTWREPTAPETRVAEVAVAKRLLATAANLCVTQDAEDHTAATALMGRPGASSASVNQQRRRPAKPSATACARNSTGRSVGPT